MEWDVFVSHASEDKAAVAEPLVRALENAGLRVWYDRIELQLGDSLRQRIDEGLAHSRFGIVVLSPAFFAKHWPQQELNGLAQREVGGEKVILPIWNEIEAEDVRRYSPMLADRVAARWSEGLETVVAQILNAVRGEEAGRRGGARSASETTRAGGVDHSSLVLIASAKGKNLFVHSERIESAETLRLDLVPANARERAFLAGFADERRGQIYVAYDVTAIFGWIESISHTRARGKEHWNLEVKPDEPPRGMEVSLQDLSADQVAELRARRILLNERWKGRRNNDLNDTMVESFISGHGTPLEVGEPPLPALFRDLKSDPDFFVTAARLVCVLWLQLSGVVEHILDLDLRMQGNAALAVRFEGQRRRQYSNADPAVIRVEGLCRLA
jgi:hypothetical protein